MANKEKAKIFDIGGSKAVYIPASIRTDSSYPFNEETELMFEIQGDKLVLRKVKVDE